MILKPAVFFKVTGLSLQTKTQDEAHSDITSNTFIEKFQSSFMDLSLLGLTRLWRNYSYYQCRKSQKLEAFKLEERFSCPGFSSDQINCLSLVEKNCPEIIIKVIILLFESCSMNVFFLKKNNLSTWLRLRQNCEKDMV